jgi:hypothetical protein
VQNKIVTAARALSPATFPQLLQEIAGRIRTQRALVGPEVAAEVPTSATELVALWQAIWNHGALSLQLAHLAGLRGLPAGSGSPSTGAALTLILALVAIAAHELQVAIAISPSDCKLWSVVKVALTEVCQRNKPCVCNDPDGGSPPLARFQDVNGGCCEICSPMSSGLSPQFLDGLRSRSGETRLFLNPELPLTLFRTFDPKVPTIPKQPGSPEPKATPPDAPVTPPQTEA